MLLAAVFLCAACGLVYELALITLGQYLVGGTVYQTSLVLGVFVCAMGLGSFASKPLLPRAAAGFAARRAGARAHRRAVGAGPLRRVLLARPLHARAAR